MAGIITDFKNDIQRLQDVKKAIIDVKNELKSINIKVDIDIAKGLEARLKSLTTQYNALVAKIAEAEGKIMLSTKKINDASEKIIQAQEKMSKAAGIPTGNTSSQANTVETTSIQAQAKAYEDLRTEIDSILGTRSQNIKRMIEETNAIRLINVEIKKITKSQGESASLSSAKQRRLEQLNNSLLTHKTVLSEVRQALNNNVRLDNAAATSMNGLSQSLSRMRIAYRELTEEERNSPFGKELLTSINQADTKIKQLDATIGNHQRNVGNYASGWNGLGMSVQQIVRELPAAKMGLNMFFLAISNNLPILVDEINRARVANEALKASGKSSTPVWKQVASSLFSWQSAMMVGITLLTVYGKDIVDWVSSLFSAEKQLDATTEAQKKLNEAQSEGIKNAQSELIKLRLLRREAEDESKSRSERLKAVYELQRLYPGYLGNIEKEKILAGQVAGEYQTLMNNIKNAAIAKAQFDKAVSVAQERDTLQEEFNVRVSSSSKILKKFGINDTEQVKAKLKELKKIQNTAEGRYFGASQRAADIKTLQSISDAYDKLVNKEEELERITNKIDLSGTTDKIIEGSVKAIEATIALKREALKNVTDKKDYARIEAEIQAEQNKLDAITGQKNVIAEKIQRKYEKQQLENDRRLIDQADELEQQRINLLADGAEKERAQRELDHKKALQQIDREREELREKQIEAARQLYNDNPKNKKGTFYQSQEYKNARILTKSDQDYFLKKEANENTRYAIAPLLEIQQKYADKRLQIEEKFNKDIADLREAREKAEKDGDANRVLKIDSLINKAITEKGKSLLSYDLEKFKASPEYVKAFENLGNVSEETLKHLLAKLEEYKQKAAETLDPVELREYTSTLEEIQEEINNRDIFGTLAKQKKEVTAAYKALIQAENELNKSRGTESEEEALENYRKAKDRLIKANNEYAKSESEAIAKTEELISAIRGIGDVVGGEAGKVIDLISNIASFALTSMEGVKTASSGASKAVQAVEKASVILGIIGAAIQLIQQLNSLLPDQYSKYEKYAEKVSEINKMRDAVNEYKLAVLEAQHAEDRWFAEDRLQDLKNFREVNKEVTEAYFDKLFESQAIYQNKSGGGWLTKIAHYTNPATWLKKIGLPDWLSKTLSLVGSSMFGLEGLLGQLGIMGTEMASNDSYKYDKNQVAAIANLRIETRKAKKGFLGTGIGGKSQKTDDLVSWVKNNLGKDLFDKDGMIDEVLAKDILEKYGDKLVGQTQETLKTLVDLKEKYNEFQEQLQEYVSSLYEPLVDNMVNSLWDWLDGGKSALDSFKDYASNTFRDIVSDMLRTIVLKDVIGDYKEKVLGLYKQYSASEIKEEELMKQIAAFSGELSNKFQDQAPVLQGMLEKINEAFKQQGIDLSDKQDVAQTATKRGVETITQDQAGELTGRITDVQGTTRDIKEQAIQQTETLSILNLKADALLNTNSNIRNIADETRTILANSYLELRQISENTGAIVVPIREMNDKLEKIQRNTENL